MKSRMLEVEGNYCHTDELLSALDKMTIRSRSRVSSLLLSDSYLFHTGQQADTCQSWLLKLNKDVKSLFVFTSIRCDPCLSQYTDVQIHSYRSAGFSSKSKHLIQQQIWFSHRLKEFTSFRLSFSSLQLLLFKKLFMALIYTVIFLFFKKDL